MHTLRKKESLIEAASGIGDIFKQRKFFDRGIMRLFAVVVFLCVLSSCCRAPVFGVHDGLTDDQRSVIQPMYFSESCEGPCKSGIEAFIESNKREKWEDLSARGDSEWFHEE